MRRALLCLIAACSGGDPDAHAPAVATAPAAPVVPAAAATLAATFASDLVGAITPIEPTAGDYAMALTMSYDAFPTMELHLSERLTGTWRMTLATDHTATACLGSVHHKVSNGQYHYKPAGQREHRDATTARLLALGGSWSVTDGVATIQFDQAIWGSCALDSANRHDKPVIELRCVGVAPPARVTDRRLACEASDQSQLLGLGMPYTVASRAPDHTPWHSAPHGHNVIFGAPGLEVELTQGARDAMPTIKFHPAVVTMFEPDYQQK